MSFLPVMDPPPLTDLIVVEANYSVALMLLLKYPPPFAPHSPQTFVDDAIYLRDNFGAAGGAKIIRKYSGRSPPVQLSESRPTTPLGRAFSPKERFSRNRSPLPTPARFLQQQGGIEALFQGATKGVLERGERLGINQAVRDAVGEVKKNMQGIQASRTSSAGRRAVDIMKWPVAEGRAIPFTKVSVSAMNKRNQQLARMLDQAMADLRTVSVSEDGNAERYKKAMDLAIAKVDFVKIYLEDANMPLPSEASDIRPASTSPIGTATVQLPLDPSRSISSNLPITPGSDSGIEKTPGPTAGLPLQSTRGPESGIKKIVEPADGLLLPSPSIHGAPTTTQKRISNSQAVTSIVSQNPKDEGEADSGLLPRPCAPVPTRSSIAQSSFSWMLQPDSGPSGSGSRSPPKSSSPFPKSGRGPTTGAGREKSAFLFGDDGESKLTRTRLVSLVDADEGFNLGTIRNGKDE